MKLDARQLIEDPELLAKVLQEWRILHELVRESPVHFCVYDENDKLISWNDAYEANHPDTFALHRAEAEAGTLTYREIIKYELAKVVPAERLERELDRRVRVQRQGNGTPATRYYDSAGHMKVYKYKLASGAVAGLAMDINDLIEAQENLANMQILTEAQNRLLSEMTEKTERENERLMLATELAGFGVWEWEIGPDKIFFDDKMLAILGLNGGAFDPETFRISAATHPEDRTRVRDGLVQALKGHSKLDVDFRIIRPDGTERTVRASATTTRNDAGRATRLIGAIIDLTEPRRMQEQLTRAQRLEAVGELTGGVAHDFNNLLAVILGNLELLQANETLQGGSEFITAALAATRRGADLTHSLLSFARQAPLHPQILDLNTVVLDAKSWMARALPDSIEIETSLSSDLLPVSADQVSSEGALLNLLLNARDAMEGHGRLTLATSHVWIDETSTHPTADDIKPGLYVNLAVHDTGHGIPEEMRSKVFEPFYSSKPPGEGSGLGLSMVMGFMRQSQGTVRIQSEPGQGTTIELLFPAAAEAEAVSEISVTSTPEKPGEGQKILVAEDEDEVRKLLVRMLEIDGYTVVPAPSGDAALAIFESQPDFDLLLTDHSMPGRLQGASLAARLRELKPDLPVVFASARMEVAELDDLGFSTSDVQLMKPILRADLLAAVAGAIG